MSEQIKRIIIFFVIFLGICLVIVGIFYVGNKSALAPKTLQNNEAVKNSQEQVALPKPTGKIEDAVNATEVGIVNEDNLLKEEESSANSAVNDSSEVSSFDQSYDENEL